MLPLGRPKVARCTALDHHRLAEDGCAYVKTANLTREELNMEVLEQVRHYTFRNGAPDRVRKLAASAWRRTHSPSATQAPKSAAAGRPGSLPYGTASAVSQMQATMTLVNNSPLFHLHNDNLPSG